MIAGEAALCSGEVLHRRMTPTLHEFRYPVSYVWLDPDAPEDVCDRHPLWSSQRAAPARFRRTDYGDGSARSLTDQVRAAVATITETTPTGPIRMLTQVRRWGWLFNPITVFLVWHDDPARPLAAVLEVTNTPWKERVRYPVLLHEATDDASQAFVAQIPKRLHVSPFLDENFDYALRVAFDAAQDALSIGLDVISPSGHVVVATELRLRRQAVTRRRLSRALMSMPTHRVSAGIHLQAARLWLKRVPVVAHPKKRALRP
jgi:uncharacterized protein